MTLLRGVVQRSAFMLFREVDSLIIVTSTVTRKRNLRHLLRQRPLLRKYISLWLPNHH